MLSRMFRARQFARTKVKHFEEPKEVIQEAKQSQSKTVYAYLNDELVGEWDSITKCAQLLGLSRAMIKKAIDNQTVLDNGFLLTLNKK